MLAFLIIFQVILLCLNLNKKITGLTGDDGTKAVQIMVPMKCLSYILRTLEMLLINCEINISLTWSAIWCKITDAKLKSRYCKTIVTTKIRIQKDS